jgi:hypothetical protein
MKCLLITLYVIGGVLEFYGLAVVAIDIRDAEKRAKVVPDREIAPVYGGAQISSRGLGRPGRRKNPIPALVEEAEIQRRLLRATVSNLKIAVRESRENVLSMCSSETCTAVSGVYSRFSQGSCSPSRETSCRRRSRDETVTGARVGFRWGRTARGAYRVMVQPFVGSARSDSEQSQGGAWGRRRTNERMRSRRHMPPADRQAPRGGSANAAAEPPLLSALR